MSTDATAALAAVTDADFANGGHRTAFTPALRNVAQAANETAAAADAAAGSAAAAAASQAAAQAITGGVQGFGSLPLQAPRNGELGSAAYAEVDGIRGRFFQSGDSTYQILPTDFGKLIVATSGTRTWALPLAADLPDGWFVRFKNRSGNNLTINRSGSDTINAAATSLTIATGSSGEISKTGTSTFESS